MEGGKRAQTAEEEIMRGARVRNLELVDVIDYLRVDSIRFIVHGVQLQVRECTRTGSCLGPLEKKKKHKDK
jgi:hypothetical protein